MKKRFYYNVVPRSGCAVATEVLNQIAQFCNGTVVYGCVIETELAVKDFNPIMDLVDKENIEIRFNDRVENYANFLYSVAREYPNATSEDLVKIFSKEEFAFLL